MKIFDQPWNDLQRAGRLGEAIGLPRKGRRRVMLVPPWSHQKTGRDSLISETGMQIALIAMTILGCDDTVTQCHYIATAPKQYASVALCDAASQKELSRIGNVNYPSVVAVCEKREAKVSSETAAARPAPAPLPTAASLVQPAANPLQPVTKTDEPGLVAHAMTLVSDAGSSAASMGGAMVRWPTHMVSKSYSWLIRRVTP